jgi:ribonucleoside-diphosphate reductase alpha chain
MGGTYVPSLLAAIGDIIERHMFAIGFLGQASAAENAPALAPPLWACPRCARRTLVRQENCDNCTACGYSKCD